MIVWILGNRNNRDVGYSRNNGIAKQDYSLSLSLSTKTAYSEDWALGRPEMRGRYRDKLRLIVTNF
jgi:hypothetical protein